ncbi:hypothetical protein GW17_00029915 [Ensete ventricosum]|nr:hypothetical protein GW17_00029915 [Ensete ventricosum]
MKNHNSLIAATIAASCAVASVRLRLARILRACRPLLVQPLLHAMVLHAIAAIRLWQARSRPLACGYYLCSLYPCATVAFATSAACSYRLCDYLPHGPPPAACGSLYSCAVVVGSHCCLYTAASYVATVATLSLLRRIHAAMSTHRKQIWPNVSNPT